MAGFQSAPVTTDMARAVEGDFASVNPRSNVLAGPGGLVAGALGLTIARFAWLSSTRLDGDGAPAIANSFGAGAPAGFVHREQQGSILEFRQISGMTILPGQNVTVHDRGDFFAKNRGPAAVSVGQKVFASLLDGSAAGGAAGSVIAGGTSTAASVAAATGAFTGSIADNILTITAVGSGVAVKGGTLAGTAVLPGTKIVEQLLPLTSGEAAGGIGRYRVSIGEQAVASTAITETYGVLTTGGTITGTFGPGQSVTGANITSPTTVQSQLTGTTGGAGTYVVDNNAVVASAAVTSSNYAETRFWVMTPALVGNDFKMTSTAPN